MIENNYVRKDPEFVRQALGRAEVSCFINRDLLGVATAANGTSYDMLAWPVDDHRVNLLGFFAPGSMGRTGLPQIVYNINDIQNLPREQLRHIDRTGKGVGARLYNSLGALMNSHDREFPCTLYSTTVDMRYIFDARTPNDGAGKWNRFVAHTAELWRLTTRGAAEIVEQAERQYGPQCDAAIWTQPYLSGTRQPVSDSSLPPTFALIRHSNQLRVADQG